MVCSLLISIHASHTGTTARSYAVLVHWFLRSLKTNSVLSGFDNRTSILNVKGSKVWMRSIKPFYHNYITILAEMQAKYVMNLY